MDTHAAVRQLEVSGLSREQAEAIVQVAYEASGHVPSAQELRVFVLEHDAKLERLRSEMHQEFAQMHQEFAELRREMYQEFSKIHAVLAALPRRRWWR